MAFFFGRRESQMATFLLSEEWPAVATILQDPRNTKSLVTLLWHWYAYSKKKKKIKLPIFTFYWSLKQVIFFVLTKNDLLSLEANPTWNKLNFPSPSATPNLLPCWLNRTRVTLAKAPAERGVETGWLCPHSHNWTEPSCEPVKSVIQKYTIFICSLRAEFFRSQKIRILTERKQRMSAHSPNSIDFVF